MKANDGRARAVCMFAIMVKACGEIAEESKRRIRCQLGKNGRCLRSIDEEYYQRNCFQGNDVHI
jgi:hypothetical protein